MIPTQTRLLPIEPHRARGYTTVRVTSSRRRSRGVSDGHVPEDRYPPGVADEIEAVIRDPNAPEKPTDNGIAIRKVKNGRTIFINKNYPWRSTAFDENDTRWDKR